MSFTRGAYSPTDGLKNTTSFPTTPASETAARKQFQDVFDQVLTLLNGLMTALESVTTGSSGAENIGSAAIANVTGTTIRAQISDLKTQLDAIVAGSVTDGSITTAKLAADAVTGDKVADDAINTEHIADGAVGSNQIADSAVTAGKFGLASVAEANIATDAVTETKLGTGAVTEGKIGTGAVTQTKLGTRALAWTLIKKQVLVLGDNNITISSQVGKSEMLLTLASSSTSAPFSTVALPLESNGLPDGSPAGIIARQDQSGYPDFALYKIYFNSATSIRIETVQTTNDGFYDLIELRLYSR